MPSTYIHEESYAESLIRVLDGYVDARIIPHLAGFAAAPEALKRQVGFLAVQNPAWADPRKSTGMELASSVRGLVRAALRELPEDAGRSSFAVAQHPYLVGAIRAMVERLHFPEGDVSNVFVSSWLTERLRLDGMKHYAVAPGLASQLMQTDVRGVSAEMLRLPYKTLALLVPEEVGGLAFREILVTEELHEGKRAWHLVCVSAPNPVDFSSVDFPGGEHERRQLIAVQRSSPLPDRTQANMRVLLDNPEEPIESVFARVRERAREVYDLPSFLAYKQIPDAVRPDAHFEPAFKLLLNTILYLGWPDAEQAERDDPARAALIARRDRVPVRSPKRGELSAKIRAMPWRPRTILGESVKPIPSTHDLRRILVAGHWKMQAHGIGRALRKLIHVEPYWRGEGELANPMHVLE